MLGCLFVHPPVRKEDRTRISTFRTRKRVVSTFRRGRMFLAGDAAHLSSPLGGPGMPCMKANGDAAGCGRNIGAHWGLIHFEDAGGGFKQCAAITRARPGTAMEVRRILRGGAGPIPAASLLPEHTQ